MNTENKHKILVWAVVILAALNISTLATIGYHIFQSNKVKTQSSGNLKQLETDAEKFSGRYFRDQLDLSSDQMDVFRDFNRSFRQQARTITEELAEKRSQMLSEMTAGKSDTTILSQLSEDIGALHSTLKKITYQYYLNIKNISNAEQQQKLEQLFREVFINDIHLQTPGRGKQQGWRHGKNYN